MKKCILIAFLLLTITINGTFANGSKETQEDEKIVHMASHCEWPPLEFVDTNGDIVGFEIDLVHALGEVTGYTFDIKNVAWDGIFAGMANGAYDGIASGVSVTTERKKVMDFSDTILNVTQSIIAPKAKENPATNLASLAGKKVGVLIGSTGDLFLQDSGVDIDIKAYDDVASSIEDLINGNLDYAVTDSIVASEYVLQNENFQAKLEITGQAGDIAEPIAMAFSKGDSFHVNLINKGLQELKENGTFDTLKNKWKLILLKKITHFGLV